MSADDSNDRDTAEPGLSLMLGSWSARDLRRAWLLGVALSAPAGLAIGLFFGPYTAGGGLPGAAAIPALGFPLAWSGICGLAWRDQRRQKRSRRHLT
ncbi:MAG TPA: hypothetical protein VHW01_10390 [Polyangiaceae bacterium]|nr:hypothetical protein [Polyangiaceae bacterium]